MMKANLDSCGPVALLPLPLQLPLPEEVHPDVDTDVDGGADQEEQQPNIDELSVGGLGEALSEHGHHGGEHQQGGQGTHEPAKVGAHLEPWCLTGH